MPLSQILMINIGHGLVHLLMLLFPVVAALAAKAFGEDYATLIVLTTGSWLAFGLGAIPAGWLADRWSRRGMLAVYFIGAGISCFLTAASQNYWQIAGALVVLGIFGSIYHPVGIAILADGAPKSLGKRLAVNGVWGNVGVAISALVAAALAEFYGWRSVFIIPGIISVILGLIWLFVVPARMSESRKEGRTVKERHNGLINWKKILVIIAGLSVLIGFAFNATIISIPKLFDERLENLADSATAVGFLAFGVYLLAAIAQLIVGSLIDRYQIKPIFMFIAGAQAITMLAVSNAHGTQLIILSAIMMALVYGGAPIADAVIGRTVPTHLRSRIFGGIYLISFAASTAAIPAIAVFHNFGGFTMLYILLSFLGVFVFLGVGLLPKIHSFRVIGVS